MVLFSSLILKLYIRLMEIQEKIKIIKDIKTASKLAKQVRTMLNNTAELITTNDINSKCALQLRNSAKQIEMSCDKLEDNIQVFKKEQQFSGYQLTLFDMFE